MSAEARSRLISLASVAVALVALATAIMAPSCFTSDECRPEPVCEFDDTGTDDPGTGDGL